MFLKVVLDTNILIRALLSSSGSAARIFDYYLDGAFRLVLSPLLIEELRRVLNYPHITARPGFSALQADAFVHHLLQSGELVPGVYDVRGVTADITDNALLCAAVEAHADFLVTEDAAHLLPLKFYRLIDYTLPIVDCEHFLQQLHDDDG